MAILAVPHPQEGGLQRGENIWLHLTKASVQCLRLSERFLGRLPKVDLIILEGENVRPYVRPSTKSMKFGIYVEVDE